MRRLILLLLALFALNAQSYASHVPGGNITYECLGNNQYLITLTLFEDCGTAFTSNTNQTIYIDNDCGFTTPTSVSAANTVFQQDISQLCSSAQAQSECNGGTLPGIYMHQWEAIVTLPGDCDSWTFSYSSCCRNTTTNVTGQPGYYWESVLNSQTFPCNNSPQITNPAVPYVCVGQAVCYNLGVIETDGHTLVYSLIGGQSAAGTFIPYNGGYSGAVPIPGMTIDPNTGQINFTPTVAGNYVVVVLIEEYDANGNLVGSIIHDIQFEVINCNNNILDCNSSGVVTNVTGSVFVTGPNSLEMCEGVPFCFDVQYVDPDAQDSLTFTSNITQVLPGAVVTSAYPNGASGDYSTININICWTPPPGSANQNTDFSITLNDNACPVSGQQSFGYVIDVVGSTYAGLDQTICGTQTAQLQAQNGTTFNWVALSGDPINVPGNFSCNPCEDPIASPSQTTTYEVTSNLSGNCVNKDTVTIFVVPDFTYQITQSSGTSCLQDPIQVDIIPNPGGAYTYNWLDTTFLSNSNIGNPVINATSPGNYTYVVEMTSPDGCVKLDSLTLSVASAYNPDITALVNDTMPECGDTVQLDVDLGGGIPAVCGPSTSGGCSGQVTPYTVGTVDGQNTSTTYPAPFGNWYANEKSQYLFTAAELQAAGFVGGKITEIAWEIITMGGISTYNNYQVKIGCTNLTSLDPAQPFVTGLTTVYGPQNTNVAVGWNTLTFAQAYEWDGVSNLIVEVCYDWTAQYSYTNNAIFNYTITPFNSHTLFNSDGTPACPELSPGWSPNPTWRPITRFTTCPAVPDPNNYTFDWTPAADVSDPTIQDPTSSPYTNTWYTVTVTDINGGCSDVDSVLVMVDCCAPSQVVANATSCFAGTDGTIDITPTGVNEPFIISIEDSNTVEVYNNPNGMQGVTETATGLPAGTYTIFTTDTTGCVHDTVVTITEPNEIITSVTDTTICIDGTAILDASVIGGDGGPYTLEWTDLTTGTVVGQGIQNVMPTVSTCYEVIATDGVGCTSAGDTLCVTVYDSLNVNLSAPVVAICPGEEISLAAYGGGGDTTTIPYNFAWDDGSGQISTADSLGVFPTDPLTTYCVTVTDGCETPAVTECVDVEVFPLPVIEFDSDTTEGCDPVDITFTNLTDPNLSGSCEWDFGDGQTSTDCNPTTTYTGVGTYDVSLTVTTVDGCIVDTTATSYITVHGYPTAQFDFTPDVGTILNPQIQFENLSIDNSMNEWFFGTNGSLGNSGDENPAFEFPNNNPGTYEVTLVVTNDYNCTDTITYEVLIRGIFTMYAPNAFTPDGDGINDIFYIEGDGMDPENFRLTIFDRWGQRVFTTDNPNEGWNGSINGVTAAKTDTYVWKVETRSRFDGSRQEFIGHVTLLK